MAGSSGQPVPGGTGDGNICRVTGCGSGTEGMRECCQPTSVASGDGLVLTGLRIVASVRCAPPANKPTPAERDTCGFWLDRDLVLAAPRLRSVLALGSIAWDATLAAARRIGWVVPRPKPRFGHGVETTLRTATGREVRLVASYHVSQQNTFTGKLTEPMLDEVIRRL